ncbi:hypothetical protein FN846DRAFT_41619 [Sphaerosporella brunnea]|uniref:Uncharacterized protein n=1 Tax=Sphaerosporella brunnea TaxID=1250544 RepID=A0A5J5F9C6_9PEZI|nr:hypothetical protein FN846DRAFT_41619 [Sphaerosporella brunnea]
MRKCMNSPPEITPSLPSEYTEHESMAWNFSIRRARMWSGFSRYCSLRHFSFAASSLRLLYHPGSSSLPKDFRSAVPCAMTLALSWARPTVAHHVIRSTLYSPRLSGFKTILNLRERTEIITLHYDQKLGTREIASKVPLPHRVVQCFVNTCQGLGPASAYAPGRQYPKSSADSTNPSDSSSPPQLRIRNSLPGQKRAETPTPTNHPVRLKVSLSPQIVNNFVKRAHRYGLVATEPKRRAREFSTSQSSAASRTSAPLEPLTTEQRLEVIKLVDEKNLSAYMISRAMGLPNSLVLSLVRAYKKTGEINKHPQPKIKTTPQEFEEIFSYYTIGAIPLQIASVMSMSIKTLNTIIMKHRKAGNTKRYLTTVEERHQIVASHNEGLSSSDIAGQMSLPPAAIDGIIKWYQKTGTVEFGKRDVSNLTAAEMDELRQLLAQHPSWTIAQIARESKIDVPMPTIRNFLVREGAIPDKAPDKAPGDGAEKERSIRSKLTTAEMDELCRIRSEHPSWPLRRIANETGISERTVWGFFTREQKYMKEYKPKIDGMLFREPAHRPRLTLEQQDGLYRLRVKHPSWTLSEISKESGISLHTVSAFFSRKQKYMQQYKPPVLDDDE